MSEYIEIESESIEEPAGILIHTNLTLAAEGKETYPSVTAMEEGSPLAQMLSTVAGIQTLVIDGRNLIVTADPDIPQHILIAEISDVIKEFFL
jgi:hypothetical protein